jgi:homocitrate synthase NifV
MNSEFIYDTTLRDGEQMPGVVFSKKEKITLAKKMSEFGVGIIGLMPAISDVEREVTEYLSNCGLKSKIIAATMMNKKHIDLAKDCNVDKIILFTSVSDIHLDNKLHISREENLENARRYAEYAKELGLDVSFAGEDATRADQDYLIDFINSLDGLDYFLPCDTMGCLTPFATYDFVKRLKKETDCKIGLHIHNDFGQATANTLAGLAAGADSFSGTFNGIGERAGNASIEEVVLALRHQYGQELPLGYDMLGEICDLVEGYSGIKLQEHKPISGKNAFSHESGVHVDGILKFPGNYENFDPKTIGRTRKILYGKHSGKCGLKHLFEDRFSDNQYVVMLQEIKKKSQLEKRAFSENEIREMYG